MLVEWAEDIHNDIGLWRTVEAQQRQIFGTPLPLILDAGARDQLAGFDARRIQFLLWSIWHWLRPGPRLPPAHGELKRLAEVTSQLLTERFARLPQDSGLKKFLATPNNSGWDIKRKLLWMGINAYLFRLPFFLYLQSAGRDLEFTGSEPDFETKEAFVFGTFTEWAGLGPIDVLTETLDLSEADRATLRTWHQWHRSAFRVLAQHEEEGDVKTLAAQNIVTGQTYTIQMNPVSEPFEPGMVLYGPLTPWRGEWVWAGQPKVLGSLPEEDNASLRKAILEIPSAGTNCHGSDEPVEALKFARQFHEEFIAHHGGDLVVFSDGQAMATAEEKRMEAQWPLADRERIDRAMQEAGFVYWSPQRKPSQEFLKHNQGVGLFSHPDNGQEVAVHFNLVLSGLKKKGIGMTDDETEVLLNLVMGPTISPAFIRRLVAEYGMESLAEAFTLREAPPALALEHLLRRYKGHFLRKRRPSVSILPDGGNSGGK